MKGAVGDPGLGPDGPPGLYRPIASVGCLVFAVYTGRRFFQQQLSKKLSSRFRSDCFQSLGGIIRSQACL